MVIIILITCDTMCPAYITYLVDSALQMLLESEYNQDHRTWQDSSSVRSILFVGLNMDQAIYEDSGKCVSPRVETSRLFQISISSYSNG